MNYQQVDSETISKPYIVDNLSPTVTLDKGLKDQIYDLFQVKTDKDTYQLFCESQYLTSGSQVSITEPDQISHVSTVVREILSEDFKEFSEDPEQFEFSIFKIIVQYDSLSIMVIDSLIEAERFNNLIVIRLLSFLGRIHHPNTYHHRTLILENLLKNKSRYVREGARLGLLYLKNPSSIESLKEAIKVEVSINLQKKLIETLTKLEG